MSASDVIKPDGQSEPEVTADGLGLVPGGSSCSRPFQLIMNGRTLRDPQAFRPDRIPNGPVGGLYCRTVHKVGRVE